LRLAVIGASDLLVDQVLAQESSIITASYWGLVEKKTALGNFL
jgi:hypothetical protein